MRNLLWSTAASIASSASKLSFSTNASFVCIIFPCTGSFVVLSTKCTPFFLEFRHNIWASFLFSKVLIETIVYKAFLDFLKSCITYVLCFFYYRYPRIHFFFSSCVSCRRTSKFLSWSGRDIVSRQYSCRACVALPEVFSAKLTPHSPRTDRVEMPCYWTAMQFYEQTSIMSSYEQMLIARNPNWHYL